MHLGKLNLCQTISASSRSRASVFAILGVTSEELEEVACLSRLT